jgi:hypothetical protein
MHSNGSAYGAPAPAVSSKRMTYGAINSNTREARERQELFAGADPYRSPYQQQQQQMPEQELNNKQLLEQAQTTHKDTTATARRALQVSAGQLCSVSTPLVWNLA